jgi:hypothetical protein
MTVLQQYAKALIGAIVAALGAAGAALADGHMTTVEGVAVAATFFGALGGVAGIKNVLSVSQLRLQPNLPVAQHIAQLPPQTNHVSTELVGDPMPPIIVPHETPSEPVVDVLGKLDKVTRARLEANAQRRHQTVEDDAARIITSYFK